MSSSANNTPVAGDKPKSKNAAPWIIAGVLGCLIVCLLFALAGGVIYLLSGVATNPLAARASSTPTAAPTATKPAATAIPTNPPTALASATKLPVPTVLATVAPTGALGSVATAAPTGALGSVATATRTPGTNLAAATATRTPGTNLTAATATRTTNPGLVPPLASPSPRATGGTASFTGVTFAVAVTGSSPDVKPIDPGTRFLEGIAKVYAIFSYTGPVDGSQWRYETYLDGKLQPDLSDSGWDLSGTGTTWASMWNDKGITPGNWEYRIYMGTQVVQKAAFTVDANKPGDPYIDVIRFAEGMQDDKPVNVHKPDESFGAGITELYAFFDAGNMSKTLKLKREWYRDGNLLVTNAESWSGAQIEKDWWSKYSNADGIQTGAYVLKLYLNDKLVQTASFVVE